jgi:hydroxyacylglutathione hydrolase
MNFINVNVLKNRNYNINSKFNFNFNFIKQKLFHHGMYKNYSKSFIKKDNNTINNDYTNHSLLKHLFMFGYNQDNIGYILHEPVEKVLIGIDFGEFDRSKVFVEKVEEKLNASLKYILTTHSHNDHSGGNEMWKKYRGSDLCIVAGNTAKFGDVVPFANKFQNDLDILNIGDLCIATLYTPGHIKSHVSYVVTHVNESSTKTPFLFCGDTLFIGGCGKVFQGTHEELYNSIKTLSYLPNDTLVFPGHEYTVNNLKFCLKLDPHNDFAKDKFEWATNIRKNNEFTVGGRLIEEKLYNPFLRCGDSYYLNLTEEDTPEKSFKKLRLLKDNFRE